MVTSMMSMVDKKLGTVDRRILIDQDIYERELEQVFARSWLFVAHESQISKANDFTSAYMCEDPVLVTRDSKGKLHTFLNMCRHRGNRICRADAGNTPSFMCTYHGWTFSTDGKLVGVPGYKEAYFEELDRSQWGLVEASSESYKGMIFANWDKTAPNLSDYLGDMAWYLDILIDRRDGGIEFIGGAHKWIMPCNWKLPADNFVGDGYHLPVTHRSNMAIRDNFRTDYSTGKSYSAYAGNGHGLNLGGAAVDSVNKVGVRSPLLKEYMWEHRDELERRLGEVRKRYTLSRPGINVNVFPNLASISTGFRVWHPRGPEKTEVWAYSFADKDAPKEVKDAMRAELFQTFGPAGNFEQDDMNNFGQGTSISKSLAARKTVMNLQLGLNHDHTLEELPGVIGTSPGEANQRAFYARWAEVMDAPSWSSIKLDPKTQPVR